MLPERLNEALIGPVVRAAQALRGLRPRQDQLSGMHNPFGRAAALADAWKFLDLCESRNILDAVANLIGGDLVLWDSELYLDAEAWEEARAGEGRYWPADPLAGAFVDIVLATAEVVIVDVVRAACLPAVAPGAHYVIRYMPATSLYNRDPLFPANRIAMEERPLVNYLNRPIWLVRGEDRAGSDFAAGFSSIAPEWAANPMLRRMEV
jgi:hypothetical protein